MEKIKLAPIVLFAYQRPLHTQRTLESLYNNFLANRSILYVYVDAPKKGATDEQIEKNKEVRRIVRSKQWCGEVHVIEQSINQGLAASIRNGVSEIVQKYGCVIVVEDDLQLSPAFLDYMNKALHFYESYPAVFSIGGYTYPEAKMAIPADYSYDTYVCLRNCSWGWATWKDRWEKIDWSATRYQTLKASKAMREAFNRMGDDEFDMFYAEQERGLNIWSIFFTMAHFEHHAVAIYPCKSYVDNIGLDGSGENCSINPSLNHTDLSIEANPRFVDVLYEDSRIVNAFYNVNSRTSLPLWKRAVNRIWKQMRGKPLFLKKKVYE